MSEVGLDWVFLKAHIKVIEEKNILHDKTEEEKRNILIGLYNQLNEIEDKIW